MFLRVGAPLIMALGLLAAMPAGAEDIRVQPKAVVELFTSQGCSSCPPADALFAELGQRSDLVTLAYHVDYWDYIGWPDTFGAEANSDLQRDYASSWGSARIYTPQMIVNGAEGVVGSKRKHVETALAASGELPLPVMLSTNGGVLSVSINGKPGVAPDATVWLITFLDRADVPIERGENQGKSITYTQIVTGRQILAMWDESTGAHFKLPISEIITPPSTGAAIVVQKDNKGLPGPILGAASFAL
jgi:hypothetical protein